MPTIDTDTAIFLAALVMLVIIGTTGIVGVLAIGWITRSTIEKELQSKDTRDMILSMVMDNLVANRDLGVERILHGGEEYLPLIPKRG